MSLCGLTLAWTWKRNLRRDYRTRAVFLDGPSPWLGECCELCSLWLSELYLSPRNCEHVDLCSDQNSASVNMFLFHDVHTYYFVIIYSWFPFLSFKQTNIFKGGSRCFKNKVFSGCCIINGMTYISKSAKEVVTWTSILNFTLAICIPEESPEKQSLTMEPQFKWRNKQYAQCI